MAASLRSERSERLEARGHSGTFEVKIEKRLIRLDDGSHPLHPVERVDARSAAG
jgi:hypothetical protein